MRCRLLGFGWLGSQFDASEVKMTTGVVRAIYKGPAHISRKSIKPRLNCSAFRFLSLLAFLLPSTQLLCADHPQIEFHPSVPDNVTFNIAEPPEESTASPTAQSAQFAALSDKSYTLAVGSDYRFPPSENTEFFTAYLRTPGQNKWLAYNVMATIPSQFSDKALDISVTINGVAVPVSGKVNIKFHNNSSDPFERDPSNKGELDFTKSDAPSVLLKIKDGYLFPVNITKVQFANEPQCKKCWHLEPGPISMILYPKHSETLSIPAEANTSRAIYESLFNFDPKQQDENLVLEVGYSVLGSSEQTARIEAPVHFVPSIAHLFVAVLVGGLLGYCFARLIEPDKFSFPLRALLVALGTAFVTELVAVLLNTKLQVFGADLDAKRFLPAFLLALLVAGGPKLPELIKNGIDRLRGNKTTS
jgi:hypothetical protein